MKKAFILAALLSLLPAAFLYKFHFFSFSYTPPIDEFLTPKEFNFIVFYEQDDPFCSHKINSMIDQEYENFQVNVILDPKESEIKKSLLFYAQKKGKAHHLSFIEEGSEIARNLILSDLINSFSPESIIIYLDQRCTFIEDALLTRLDALYQKESSLKVFSGFINYPSYQKEKRKITFHESALKVFKASDFNHDEIETKVDHPLSEMIKSSKESFLEAPFYLRARL